MVIFVILTLIWPIFILAQSASSCGAIDCSACQKLLGWSNFFQFIFWLSLLTALVLGGLAGYFYLKNKEEEDEEKGRKIKNLIFYGIVAVALSVVAFTSIYVIFQKSGGQERKGLYGFSCGDDKTTGTKEDLGVFSAGTDDGTGFLGENGSSESLRGGTRPAQSRSDQKNEFLEDIATAIIKAQDLSSFTSSGNQIVDLSGEQMDPATLSSDIKAMDPDSKVEFIVSDKGTRAEDIVGFRNLSMGFLDKNNKNFLVSKDNSNILGDSVIDPTGKVQEFLFVSPTDDSNFFLVEGGQKFKDSFKNMESLKKGNLENSLKQVLGEYAKNSLADKNIYAFSSGASGSDLQQCVSSGGRVTEFRNQCFANQEGYSGQSFDCSDIYTPVKGCKCPENYYLEGTVCQKKENETAQNLGDGVIYDGKLEKYTGKTCSDLTLETNNCPSSYCSGNILMYYPSAVKDECYENSEGATIKKNSCQARELTVLESASQCNNSLKSQATSLGLSEPQNNSSPFGKTSNELDKILNEAFGKGPDVEPNSSGTGAGTGASNGAETSGDDKGDALGSSGKVNDGPLPPDKGALNFNPTPGFKELKECIGLKDDQIPYNGVLVVLLNPSDPLNRKHKENVSRMYYLTREGKVLGKNGDSATEAGGQEYGARTYDKSWTGNPNGPSMWGQGWKIFKGTTKYDKNGWTDQCSYGSHDGYKTGVSEDALNPANLSGGKVTSVSRCGQHVGDKNSSAGCATMGNNSRCGFINTSKQFMSKSNGTIMQVNFIGEINPANGKFESPNCGKIDYCQAKLRFKMNSGANKFYNDPNNGYDSGDKRRVDC